MNKKIKMIIFVVLGIIFMFVTGTMFKNNMVGNDCGKEESNINEIVDEYTPLEEITDKQARQTVVSLYYKSKTTGEIIPEDRRIDSKDLLENPYKYLIELLIESPKSDDLESTIPEGTKVISAVLNGSTVEINFSKEYTEKSLKTQEEQETIDVILKTLTQLNEVEKIKILIEGEEK